MNKYIFIIISIFLIQGIFICGCTPGEEDSSKPVPDEPQKPEKVLNASPLTLSFKAEGESKTINITSNTEWKLIHRTQSEVWCLPDKTSGSGNGSIQMTASRNPVEEERSDTYVLSIEGKELVITLTQEKADLRIPLKFSSPDENFAEGDEIGLFVVNRPFGSNNPAQMNNLTENQVNNTRIIKQLGSTWTIPTNVFWKNSTTTTDAYAYYPWRETTQNDAPSNWQISVEKDQSSENGILLSSQPKYGQALNQLPNNEDKLIISFNSVIAKILVEIQLSGEAQETYQIEKAQILSAYTTGSLNLNTGQVQVNGQKSAINVLLSKDQTGITISSYLIPQTFEAGNFLTLTYIDKRYGETIELPITIDETYRFEAAKSYSFIIKLEKSTDRLALKDVSISEWGKGEDIEFPFN